MEQFPLKEDGTYAGTQIEGGIEAFRDVLQPDRIKPEIGNEPIPGPEGIRRYAEALEDFEIRNAASLTREQEDEDLLTA